MEPIKTPLGFDLPPSPEGKALARRLWEKAEAKTGVKSERDQLTDAQMKEHEKTLREEREEFEKRLREAREEEKEREVNEKKEKEREAMRERERNEREIERMRENEKEREREMREMRERERSDREMREMELKEEIRRLRAVSNRDGARDDDATDEREEIWCEEEELEMKGSLLGGSGVDSVLELSALMNLEKKLHNSKAGMVTLYELFTGTAMKELQQKFNTSIQKSSVSHGLQQYMAAFRALKRPNKQTQELITVFALQAVSSGFDTKVKAAVVAAVSVNHESRLIAISHIQKTGDGIIVSAGMAGLSTYARNARNTGVICSGSSGEEGDLEFDL